MSKPRFCFEYVFTYVLASFIITQQVPFLTGLGYDALERGILVAVCQVVAIALQIIVGYLCDQRHWYKQLFVAVVVVAAVSSFIFFSIQVKIFALQMCLLTISGAFTNSLYGVTDNWLFAYPNGRKEFSFIRAFGSVGWAIGSIVIASLISWFGYQGMAAGVLLSAVVLLGMGCLIKKPPVTDEQKKNATAIHVSDIKVLVRNKKYVLTVVILTLIVFATNNTMYSVVDKIMLLGGSHTEVGTKAMIHGFVEIPFYLFGALLIRRFGTKRLLSFAALTVFIQFVMYACTTTVSGMIWLTLWQAVTNTSYMLANRDLLYRYSDERLKSTGMLLGISVHYGLGNSIMPVLGGYLTTHFGVNVTLTFAAVSAFLAFLLSMVLRRMDRESDTILEEPTKEQAS